LTTSRYASQRKERGFNSCLISQGNEVNQLRYMSYRHSVVGS